MVTHGVAADAAPAIPPGAVDPTVPAVDPILYFFYIFYNVFRRRIII
jgi:hypothetical protein